MRPHGPAVGGNDLSVSDHGRGAEARGADVREGRGQAVLLRRLGGRGHGTRLRRRSGSFNRCQDGLLRRGGPCFPWRGGGSPWVLGFACRGWFELALPRPFGALCR